jgi:hypothetical protein
VLSGGLGTTNNDKASMLAVGDEPMTSKRRLPALAWAVMACCAASFLLLLGKASSLCLCWTRWDGRCEGQVLQGLSPHLSRTGSGSTVQA